MHETGKTGPFISRLWHGVTIIQAGMAFATGVSYPQCMIRIFKSLIGIGLALAGLLHSPAHAVDEVRLLAAETAFFCVAKGVPGSGEATGFACEVVREMARRAGHSGRFEMVPMARAMFVGAAAKNVLIVPVGRIAHRENLYQWTVKIFEDDFVVVAPRHSKVDISTVAACTHLKIGMVRNGAAFHLAEEAKWSGMRLVAHDVSNARKLHAGRLDAWLSTWNGILAAQASAGLDPKALRRGVVVRRVEAYVAGSRDLDPAIGEKWRAVFNEMVRDGTYQRLLQKYEFVLPAPLP